MKWEPVLPKIRIIELDRLFVDPYEYLDNHSTHTTAEILHKIYPVSILGFSC